jgi:hypothetical protein
MRSLIVGATLLAVLGSSHPAHAEEPPAPTSEPPAPAHELPERNLGGHTFFTPTFFPTAFVGTRFAFSQGVLQAEIPDYPLSQNRTLDVDMIGISERAEFSLRLFDRVMPFLRVTGEAFSGVSVNSVVSVGSTYAYTAGGGLQVRLLRLEEPGTELSLRASGDYGPGGAVQLLRVLEAIVQDTPASVEAALDGNLRQVSLADTERANGTLQALAAQKISKNFSVQGALGAAYNWSSITFYDTDTGEEVTLDDGRVDPKLGLAFQASASPWIPVGAIVEYSLASEARTLPNQDVGDRHYSHILGFGLNIVHPQFQVGLTLARTFGLDPVERTGFLNRDFRSGNPSISYAELGLEFTWW